MNRISWPNGKSFAFTIFDDTDSSTLQNTKPVYDFLYKHGFLTTKSVWTTSSNNGRYNGHTCLDIEYLNWLKKLNELGFEIGFKA